MRRFAALRQSADYPAPYTVVQETTERRSMGQRLSFRQYRAIDLAFFAFILCVAETLIIKGATIWYADQLYVVSAVGIVTTIVLIRWGAWAAVHAFLGGFVFCLASHASPQQYLIYCVGNLGSMLSLIWIRIFGKDRIAGSGFAAVSFGLGTLLCMQLGRALVAAALGTPLRQCPGFFTTDSLSLLFTGVVIWIARRLDGVFEDQKKYLLRVHEEEKKEKGGF